VVGHLDGLLEHSRSPVTVTVQTGLVGHWDPIWLEIVVSNLLTNAAKFGQAKPIQVTCDLAGDMARLVVRDNGIGIAAVDQTRVFERFERAVSAEHFGGFGIGLWVSRQVVEAHGGSIVVSSPEDGSGSVFTVLLPLAVGARSATGATKP
jgi:signal transduction histidine kinase